MANRVPISAQGAQQFRQFPLESLKVGTLETTERKLERASRLAASTTDKLGGARVRKEPSRAYVRTAEVRVLDKTVRLIPND